MIDIPALMPDVEEPQTASEYEKNSRVQLWHSILSEDCLIYESLYEPIETKSRKVFLTNYIADWQQSFEYRKAEGLHRNLPLVFVSGFKSSGLCLYGFGEAVSGIVDNPPFWGVAVSTNTVGWQDNQFGVWDTVRAATGPSISQNAGQSLWDQCRRLLSAFGVRAKRIIQQSGTILSGTTIRDWQAIEDESWKQCIVEFRVKTDSQTALALWDKLAEELLKFIDTQPEDTRPFLKDHLSVDVKWG